MTIASKLETINEALGDIKSSIVAKGVTPTGNITTFSTAIESISTGDEITATNTTGSAVNADDRVWVNGEDIYTRNFTTSGNPTISDTTKEMSPVSDTTSYIYKQMNGIPSSTFEFFTKIKINNVGDVNAVLAKLMTDSNTMTGTTFCGLGFLSISQYSRNTFGVSISGKNKIISDASLSTNTWYYLKLVINSEGTTLSISTDKTNWTDNTGTDVKITNLYQNGYINFGKGSSGGPFQSLSYDLSETYIKFDGNIVWTPYTTSTTYSIINDTDITSTSFTGIAQSNIANNATGSVKTLLDGNGTYAPTTTTKTITTNGTYTASAENAYGLSEVTVDVPTQDTWYNWKTDVLTDVSAGTLNSYYNRVIYGNGIYVATPLNGSTVSYSSNGTTWNSATLPTSATNITDGIYGNKFVIITYSGTCFVSVDGNTWTQSQISSTITSSWNSVTFGNGKYIAIKGGGSSNNAAISSDGITWTDITLPAKIWWQKITYGNGIFVVCGGAIYNEQNIIAYSTDGDTWNIVNLPYNARWQLLTYGDSQGFMVFGKTGETNYAYKSVNGVIWTQISNPGFYIDDFNVTYGNGFYVGSIGSVFYYSQDGNNWSTLNAINRPGAIAFDGTNFITGVYNTNYSNGNIFYLGEMECYTLTASPTTSTQVYEIPKKTSALTITAVGTGTITLSDSKVYNRNSAGDVQSPVLGTKSIDTNGTYTAASDYLDGFSSVTVDVPSAPTKKYNLLDRVKNDSNNEIGTVSGFFTDANNVEYAVVCLDAQYRLASGYVMIPGGSYNVPSYTNISLFSAKETATYNTDVIVASGYTSTACAHCRSKSFTIDNTTYYGQLPNIVEVIDIARQRENINTLDTSAGSYSSLIIPISTSIWSSSKYSTTNSYRVSGYGGVSSDNKGNEYFVVPVLEIPNT